MRCDNCDRPFKDGDSAYEIGVKRIKVVGTVVRTWHENIYVCEDCNAKEDKHES